MDALRKEANYTIDDIYALPEGERAELIDGRIYFMAAPNRRHQQILHFFDRTIGNYIQSNSGDCEIYPAPFAVFLDNDKANYVEPDISVICDPSKLDDKGCHGAPDWVIEIVSPSSRSMDYLTKTNKYRDAGVREYWIVNPEDKSISVYGFEDEMRVIHYRFGEEVPVGICNGFSIKIPDDLQIT